jgi:hypothetical protein
METSPERKRQVLKCPALPLGAGFFPSLSSTNVTKIPKPVNVDVDCMPPFLVRFLT